MICVCVSQIVCKLCCDPSFPSLLSTQLHIKQHEFWRAKHGYVYTALQISIGSYLFNFTTLDPIHETVEEFGPWCNFNLFQEWFMSFECKLQSVNSITVSCGLNFHTLYSGVCYKAGIVAKLRGKPICAMFFMVIFSDSDV